MPPKPKFTKKEITECAFCITREDGIDHVTAREIGKALNSSARPIFTVFSSMEDVKCEVIVRAKAEYRAYVERGLKKRTRVSRRRDCIYHICAKRTESVSASFYERG